MLSYQKITTSLALYKFPSYMDVVMFQSEPPLTEMYVCQLLLVMIISSGVLYFYYCEYGANVYFLCASIQSYKIQIDFSILLFDSQ